METRKLSVKAGQKTILDNIDINIYRHRVNTIVGPSGGGKSTFLKCLNRLVDLDSNYHVSGDIFLEGKNIREYSEIELRRRVGMVFQRPNPFPMSVYDNVAFGLRLQGKVKQHEMDSMVKDSLREAGLFDEVNDNLNRPASTLSGGQQQRLCIARALILKPSVLMLDEPTSSLDPVAKGRIEELMIQLRERYTVILVTHDITQARKVSDHTSMLFNGKIIASGEGVDFLESSSSDAMKAFLGDATV